MRFPDRESALHFRSRCHYARKLHREKNKEVYADPTHPQHGCSLYDELVLKERPDGDGWYIYLVRAKVGSIEVEPLSGAPKVEYQPPPKLPAPVPMVENIVKRRI